MDSSLYRAAMGGKENEYKEEVLMQYIDQLEVQITSNKNTVLHVAAQFGNQKCLEKILEKRPSLLRCLNINGETPLHVAARQGHYGIVEALICSAEKLDKELESGGGAAKEMLLRATNKDKDTALHMAVRKSGNSRVVELLTQKDEEEEFTHLANNSEETPLYLAAERGRDDYVSLILKNCASPAYGGPGGKTALHVAVMDKWSFNTENTQDLLERKPDLIKKTDAYGWTPLHYAARYANLDAVNCLLANDTSKSVIYIRTDDDNEKTALHIAAANGYVEVMEEILKFYPDCWEMVDGKGQNVLHMAVDMEKERVIEYMLEESWLIHLINQKDIDGNTPLHLLEASGYQMPKLEWHPHGDLKATNNNNMTPFDVSWSHLGLRPLECGRIIVSMDQDYITKWKGDREKRKKVQAERKKTRVEENRKRADTHLIVATLIAAVTFAASFTMPGGYDSNGGPEQGMPVLIREAAFQAFITTNTIAVICSVSSAFLCVSAPFYLDENKQDRRYLWAFWLILIAMGAMMVALITGTYVVLSHSLAIAVVACVIGCFSFLILIPEVIKLYGILKYKVVSQIEKITPSWLMEFWSNTIKRE